MAGRVGLVFECKCLGEIDALVNSYCLEVVRGLGRDRGRDTRVNEVESEGASLH